MLEFKIQSNNQLRQFRTPMINYPTAKKNIHSNQHGFSIPKRKIMMRRIVIVGSSGSGKSTLARQLGQRLSIPVIHLDKLYWKPGWIRTPHGEWHEQINSLTGQESWIMDGNYRSTLSSRLSKADTIVFLDMPRWLCMFRATKRRILYANRPRPDMAKGCKEYLFDATFPAFLRWIWDYPNRARPQILHQLSLLASEKQIVWLRTPREVQSFLYDPLLSPQGISQLGEFYEYFSPPTQ